MFNKSKGMAEMFFLTLNAHVSLLGSTSVALRCLKSYSSLLDSKFNEENYKSLINLHGVYMKETSQDFTEFHLSIL